jgi:hypothetical protein
MRLKNVDPSPLKVRAVRYSIRVQLTDARNVAVIAYRYRPVRQGPPFYEGTRTLAASAHGALINLAAKVATDQRLILKNALTGQEQVCRIVFRNKKLFGPTEVGIEFERPAPDFWRVAFPPPDWNHAR